MDNALLMGLIGAGGPIITVIATKIIEIIQKRHERRQEYTYSLQKSFFEKRLSVAESTILQLNSLKSIFLMAKDLNEMMLASAMGIIILEPEVISIVSNRLKCLCEELTTFDAAQIDIYFDIDIESKNDQLLTDLMQAGSAFIYLSRHIEAGHVNSEEDKEKARNVIFQHLSELSKSFKRSEDDITCILEKITADMRKWKN